MYNNIDYVITKKAIFKWGSLKKIVARVMVVMKVRLPYSLFSLMWNIYLMKLLIQPIKSGISSNFETFGFQTLKKWYSPFAFVLSGYCLYQISKETIRRFKNWWDVNRLFNPFHATGLF